MTTRGRQIVEALVATLTEAQIEGVADRVFEERGFSIPASQLPAIDVASIDGDPTVQDLGEFQLKHELRVDISVVVLQGTEDPPSKVADPIVAAMHAAVMTAAALVGLVDAITPGPYRWTRQEGGDGTVLRRSSFYTFEHTTTVLDLESAP